MQSQDSSKSGQAEGKKVHCCGYNRPGSFLCSLEVILVLIVVDRARIETLQPTQATAGCEEVEISFEGD